MVENKLLKVSCLDKLFVSKSLDWPYNLALFQSHNSLSAQEQLQESKQDGPCPKVRQMIH